MQQTPYYQVPSQTPWPRTQAATTESLAMQAPHGAPRHKKKQLGASIGLEKFSKLKKSSYDKRAKLDKEKALNAGKVNAYRKLQKRLADKLEPKGRAHQVGRHACAQRRHRAARRLLPGCPCASGCCCSGKPWPALLTTGGSERG